MKICLFFMWCIFSIFFPCRLQAGPHTQVVLWDQATGKTHLISKSIDGIPGNRPSVGPSISAKGRFISFSTRAKNLVVGETTLKAKALVYDRQFNTLKTFKAEGITGGVSLQKNPTAESQTKALFRLAKDQGTQNFSLKIATGAAKDPDQPAQELFQIFSFGVNQPVDYQSGMEIHFQESDLTSEEQLGADRMCQFLSATGMTVIGTCVSPWTFPSLYSTDANQFWVTEDTNLVQATENSPPSELEWPPEYEWIGPSGFSRIFSHGTLSNDGRFVISEQQFMLSNGLPQPGQPVNCSNPAFFSGRMRVDLQSGQVSKMDITNRCLYNPPDSIGATDTGIFEFRPTTDHTGTKLAEIVLYKNEFWEVRVVNVDNGTVEASIPLKSLEGNESNWNSFNGTYKAGKYRPVLSADGSTVTFAATAPNIQGFVQQQKPNIYQFNLATKKLVLVSTKASGGGPNNGNNLDIDVSWDGRFVVYRTDATDIEFTPLAPFNDTEAVNSNGVIKEESVTIPHKSGFLDFLKGMQSIFE